MSAITKQADSGFGSIELSLPRRESALCNTKSLALCAGQREGNGTQPDSDAIRFDVSDGSKAPIWCSAGDFRSTLISGHPQTGLAGPVRARSRLQRTYSIPSPIFHSTT